MRSCQPPSSLWAGRGPCEPRSTVVRSRPPHGTDHQEGLSDLFGLRDTHILLLGQEGLLGGRWQQLRQQEKWHILCWRVEHGAEQQILPSTTPEAFTVQGECSPRLAGAEGSTHVYQRAFHLQALSCQGPSRSFLL